MAGSFWPNVLGDRHGRVDLGGYVYHHLRRIIVRGKNPSVVPRCLAFVTSGRVSTEVDPDLDYMGRHVDFACAWWLGVASAPAVALGSSVFTHENQPNLENYVNPVS